MSFSWVSPELHIDAPPAVPYFCFPVSFSTLLTGEFICNCLYLNSLSNQSLAKRSFRKVLLADSCRGFNLATPLSSVSYRECVRNHACQEGRKSLLSLIGFRKFICACLCIIAQWCVPVRRLRMRTSPYWQNCVNICLILPRLFQFTNSV